MRPISAAIRLTCLIALVWGAGCSDEEPKYVPRPDAAPSTAPSTPAPRTDAATPRPDAEPDDASAPTTDLGAPEPLPAPTRLRIATFNSALERPTAGKLLADLQAGSAQARAVAAIIREVKPDILVLQEFDFDPAGEALRTFANDYLDAEATEGEGLFYAHRFAVPSNTGVPSGLDLDGDGRTDGPGDAYGFGQHPGHYAFAVLSRYPLDSEKIRNFGTFQWNDLPDAQLPKKPDGTPFYGPEALAVLRLSSKNHVDVPVQIAGGPALHLLVSHPTPPVFDGPEDRNGRRNYDEIGFWKRYLDGVPFTDERGRAAALPRNAIFALLGDLNADPNDGDGVPGAVAQVLDHPRVNAEVARGAKVPTSPGGAARPKAAGRTGDPAHHTAGWGLRADYVLPAAELTVLDSGVFWPAAGTPNAELVTDPNDAAANPSSDHRLVWVDVAWPPAQP